MNTRLFIHAGLATTAIAIAASLSLPAQATEISATASAASTLPATVPVNQDLINGDFLILANPGAGAGHVTGDGVDETTRWSFDFSAHPNYAAFIADGSLVGARLTLTLNTAFFINGVGPNTDIVFPSDANGSVFPGWVLPTFINGVFGTYSSGTISASLITVGMAPGELFNFLSSRNGLFPMVYGDDAIVTEARLTLVSAPVPEPQQFLLMLAGLGAVGGWMRRRSGG